jgi:hypothetical protein
MTTPAPPPADPAAYAGSVIRRQIARLDELADSGLAMAKEIERRAVEPAPEGEPAPPPETLAMAFSRVARAVRMTSLLQARLLKDMDEGARRAAFDHRWAAPEPAPDPIVIDDAEIEAAMSDPAFVHKVRVERIVERVAKAAHDDAETVDRLLAETTERLDDEDLYGDVLTRPVGELVALICRDLGLDPDWERLSEEAWARAEIASGVSGSPFALPPLRTAVRGGGGPPADPGARPGEERVVEGAGQAHPQFSRAFEIACPPLAPTPIGSSANGPPPPQAGEVVEFASSP